MEVLPGTGTQSTPAAILIAGAPSWFVPLPKQLRQPRDVDGDPPRLILREHLRLQRLDLGLSRVDVGERLPVGVPDDIAAGNPVGGAGKRRSFTDVASR
jgi:hypothetical protein